MRLDRVLERLELDLELVSIQGGNAGRQHASGHTTDQPHLERWTSVDAVREQKTLG